MGEEPAVNTGKPAEAAVYFGGILVTRNVTLNFKSVENEQWREYDFGDSKIRIDNPLCLDVSASGGHRVLAADGVSHYVPKGWKHLTWKVKEGEPAFDF